MTTLNNNMRVVILLFYKYKFISVNFSYSISFDTKIYIDVSLIKKIYYWWLSALSFNLLLY